MRSRSDRCAPIRLPADTGTSSGIIATARAAASACSPRPVLLGALVRADGRHGAPPRQGPEVDAGDEDQRDPPRRDRPVALERPDEPGGPLRSAQPGQAEDRRGDEEGHDHRDVLELDRVLGEPVRQDVDEHLGQSPGRQQRGGERQESERGQEGDQVAQAVVRGDELGGLPGPGEEGARHAGAVVPEAGVAVDEGRALALVEVRDDHQHRHADPRQRRGRQRRPVAAAPPADDHPHAEHRQREADLLLGERRQDGGTLNRTYRRSSAAQMQNSSSGAASVTGWNSVRVAHCSGG